MRIFDENGVEIESPDYEKGYVIPDRILIRHHEAIAPVLEQGHYETIKEYPSGGTDVAWVVDVPGVEAKKAWDEYEDIMRYVLYTEEQLKAIEEKRSKPTAEDRIKELEEALELLLSGATE